MKSAAVLAVVVTLLLFGKPLTVEAAQSCGQMNERVFGGDGRGGEAARFRALKAKIDAETRAGERQAAAKDRAEYVKLAATILAGAKTMRTVKCQPRIVAQATVAPPTAPPVRPPTENPGPHVGNNAGGPSRGTSGSVPTLPPGAYPGSSTVTMRSVHGCVGFNGAWQTQTGVLRIRNGAGLLGSTWFSGNVSGNVYSGGWAAPQPGPRGTFVMTLAQDGDSIHADLKNTVHGNSGSWTAPCVGS